MSKSPKIVIVDFELGNLYSVQNVFHHLGIQPTLSTEKAAIKNADAIVLPGVGAFGDAINNLNRLDLIQPIQDFIASGKPFLGICLGMQLLFSQSEEFGDHKGLNIIPGSIKKFPSIDHDQQKVRVPQIAWNKISPPQWDKNKWSNSPLSTTANNEYMYFVHSYYALPEDKTNILSTTQYHHITYCSAVSKNNIFAFQFHPEKSGPKGIEIYQNWINAIQ